MGIGKLIGKIAKKTLLVAAAYGGQKVAAKVAEKLADKVSKSRNGPRKGAPDVN